MALKTASHITLLSTLGPTIKEIVEEPMASMHWQNPSYEPRPFRWGL